MQTKSHLETTQRPAYGMTETCGISVQTSVDDDIEDKAHTVGRPLPYVEVRISDPLSGVPVAPGELGEVCVRGYLVMSGYFEMPMRPGARSTPKAGFTPATLAAWIVAAISRLKAGLGK